mmetsp:Transcript_36961/g.106675  ORF Transcript_36961/g.106675 Transcript_36961/m.106675 type:complete len:215 (-) Transcript_36961:139-783(-)
MMFIRFCSNSMVFLFSSSFFRIGSISCSRFSYNMLPFDSFWKAVCICCRCSARARRSFLLSSARRFFSASARCRSSRFCCAGAALFKKPPMASRARFASSASWARTAVRAWDTSSDSGCSFSAAAKSCLASSNLPPPFRARPRRKSAFACMPAATPFRGTSATKMALPATSSACACSPSLRWTWAKLQYSGIKSSTRSCRRASTKSSTKTMASR